LGISRFRTLHMKQKSSMKIKSSHWQSPVGGVFHTMHSTCSFSHLLQAVPLRFGNIYQMSMQNV